MANYRLQAGLESDHYRLVNDCPGKVAVNIKDIHYFHGAEIEQKGQDSAVEFHLDADFTRDDKPLEVILSVLGQRVDELRARRANAEPLSADDLFLLAEVGPVIAKKNGTYD